MDELENDFKSKTQQSIQYSYNANDLKRHLNQSSSFIERISQVRPISLQSSESDENQQVKTQQYIVGINSQLELEYNQSYSSKQNNFEPAIKKTKSQKFLKTYGLCSLILLGFGNTIGAGVFALTGLASKFAGQAVFLSYIISGIIALITAFVFAEFSSIIPKSGSSYIYTYSTFGELPAWIVGWNQNLRYGGSAACLSRGFSKFFMSLFISIGFPLPAWLDQLSFFGIADVSPITVIFIIFCTVISNKGSEFSGKFSNFATQLKLCILAIILFFGLYNFDQNNYSQFFKEEKGFLGVIEGSTILFFAYLGFDFITTISEEAKNAKKDVPVAIILSVVLSMIIYVLISFSVCGVGNLSLIHGDGETALAEIFTKRGFSWMCIVIQLCALVGITSAGLTSLMSQSRVLYSYAKDGLFFKIFAKIDSQSNVPVAGSWLQIIPICLAAFFINITVLAKICSLCNLMTYAFINGAVISLRLQNDKSKKDHSNYEIYKIDKKNINKNFNFNLFCQRLEQCSPWSFLVFSFISCISFSQKWSLDFKIIMGIIIVINFAVIHFFIRLKQKKSEDKKKDHSEQLLNEEIIEIQDIEEFRCPLVPFLPCLGIYCNFILCSMGVGQFEWIAFIIFELIGCSFYFIYGYKNSKLQYKIFRHNVNKNESYIS